MTPKTQNGQVAEPELTRFSLRLREDFLVSVEKQARQEGRSVNDMLNEIVGDYLDGGNCRCCGKPL